MIFTALSSPNYEIAYLISAGYTVLATLTAGLVVAIPNLSEHIRPAMYLSFMKYPYQALVLLFFKDNMKTVDPFGRPIEWYLHTYQLDEPSTIWANLVVCLAIFLLFVMAGFCSLKYMYKERR